MWAVPGARTKNGRQHAVYLTPLAREIIAACRGCEGKTGYLLTTTGIKRRLETAMLALARADHDLRRTCATNMAELGMPPHVIEVALNHVSGHKAGVAGIYSRTEHSAERKAALELWAAHVEALVMGRSAKVIAFKGAR